MTAGTFSSDTDTPTWPAKSSVSAAWVPRHGSPCLSAETSTDTLILQVKEAEASVLERFLIKSAFAQPRSAGGRRPAIDAGCQRYLSRVAAGQRGLDGKSQDYYMRQLWDWKLSANIDTMTPQLLSSYAEMCGWTLARAHARSGDAIAIAPTWAPGIASTRLSLISPSRTPIRTRPTITPWSTPSRPGKSRPRQASNSLSTGPGAPCCTNGQTRDEERRATCAAAFAIAMTTVRWCEAGGDLRGE